LRVEGWARLSGVPEREARGKALEDARREAVAAALRTHLAPNSLAENAETLSAKVLADPARFIVAEKLAWEGREGDFYKVRLEAGVRFGEVAEELRGLGILPRDTEISGRLALTFDGSPDTARRISRTLAARGFEVTAVSTGASPALPDGRLDSVALASAAALGVPGGARIWVVGSESSGARSELAAGDLHSSQARVRIWAWDSLKRTQAGEADHEGTAHGASEEIARGKALSAAAELAADELALELARAVPPVPKVRLLLSGFPEVQELRRFLETLRAQEGVEGVEVVYYAQGRASLRVGLRDRSGEELAAQVLRIPGFQFDIRSVTPAEVELERR